MKNKEELLKEFKDVFSNTTYEKTSILPFRDNTGYKKYGNNWATVVSIDIRGFKKMFETHPNEKIVKLLQIFTKSMTDVAKDAIFSKAFRDIYFAGDEVIAVFESSTNDNAIKAIEFVTYAHSISNFLIKTVAEQYGVHNFKCGIGVWTSSDNTLTMVGQKYSTSDSSTTLIGSAINYGCFLGKKANKDQHKPIMINKKTFDKLSQEWQKYFKYCCNEFNEQIYEGEVHYTNYK